MADPTPTDPTWPTPSGRDAVLDRVLRGGRRRLMINRLLIAGAATAVAGGLATGVALGATDTVSVLEEEVVETGDALAGLRPCPGLDPVAQLRGGDRVFLTGRSDDGEWLQLRSPFDADDRFWIEADLVTGDDDVDALPTATCGDVELTLTLPDGSEVTVTTTTSTVPGETTTTTEPEETTTTASTLPGQTTQPTTPSQTTQPTPATTQPTTPPTTATTQPPDNTPPTIGTISVPTKTIDEDGDAGNCSPLTSVITASVQDPQSTVTTVRLEWTLRRDDTNAVVTTGNQLMTRVGATNNFRATLGPFGNTTLSFQNDGTISMRVVAISEGGIATKNVPVADRVHLHDCSFG